MKLFTVILFVTLTVVAYSQKHHYIFDKTLQYSDYKIIQNATTQRFFINELLKFKKSRAPRNTRRKNP